MTSSPLRPGRSPAPPPIARDRKTPARFAKAVALHQAGRLPGAIALYRRILDREPDLPEVHGNLGAALAALGKLGEAVTSYRRAIGLNCGDPRVWCNFGVALAGLGRLDEAEERLRRAVLLDPGFAEAHGQLGNALRLAGRLAAAEDACRFAVALDPTRPAAHAHLGRVLLDQGRALDAAAAFRQAVALAPDLAGAHNDLALALKEAGRLTEAGEAAEQAIRLAPRRAAYYANLAEVRTFAPGDAHVAALEALACDRSLGAEDCVYLHFTLAKAYDDMGRDDDAFAQLLAGNSRKRRTVAYDEAAMLARMERTRALFTRDLIAARQGCGEPTPVPAFILGMPRAGTTLIEQILASHPQVAGGGELKLFDQAVGVARALARTKAGEADYPDLVADLPPGHIRLLGSIYAQELARRAPRALRITDKMPSNFIYTGLIHLALPQATIIHVVRDPVDTCVSCFSRLFVDGQAYSYDLAELGRYYGRYRALMAHWRSVLPPGRILDVRYEDVVADLEGAARRIVTHCGLAWDARCLDFHRTERTVRTASAAQVRQPIYGHAVARWRRYERHLAPLLAELALADAGVKAA